MENSERRVTIPKERIDHIMNRFEIRNHSDVLVWAINMLYDISILDEGGWRLSFQKCDIDMENKRIDYKKFYPIHYSSLASLAPTAEGFWRLPLPEVLDENQKVTD